jgi:hypothetical protein
MIIYEVISMKKKLLVCLFACAMALSFAVPAIANDAVVAEVVYVSVGQEDITPFSEHTRSYFRWSVCGCGRLQMRVWGMTSGTWLTPWTYL